MAVVAGAFTLDQITRTIFADEWVTYTLGPISLPVGDTVVYDVRGWNGTSPDREVILTAVAGTQNAGVRLIWTADDVPSNEGQGWADAWPGSLYPLRLWGRSVDHSALVLRNTNAAAVPNYQLNYTVRVRTLLVADKVLWYPGAPLSAADQAVLAQIPVGPGEPPAIDQVRQAVALGRRPPKPGLYHAAYLEGREATTDRQSTPWHFVVGNSGYADLSVRVDAGTVLELVRLVPAAAYADQPILTVTRDNQQVANGGFVAVNLAAAVGPPAQPFGPDPPYRVYAQSLMLLRLYGTPGSTYAVWPELNTYQRSTLGDAALDIGARTGPYYARVRAGLM
jgi:hypothetical protein